MKRKKIQSLFDITIGQFQKIDEIEDITNIQIISIMYDIELDQANKIPKKQVDQEANNIRKVLMEKPRFVMTWKGYGFEPDLDNMASGAFGDAETYAQDISTLHLFTATLYRPIKKDIYWLTKSKKYNIEEYEGASKREEEAKQLPLALALSAQGFFLSLRKSFMSVIQERLAQKSKRLKALQKQNDSNEIGDGDLNSMRLLEGIISNLNQLQKSQFQKSCII